MINKIESYLEERGFNILLVAKAKKIACLETVLSPEQKEKNLILLASGGKLLWEKLPTKEGSDPIDSHTVNVMEEMRKTFFEGGLEILFPNDLYLLPLQQIGRHFNLSHPTPMGPDLSCGYGPWFGFRGVLLTTQSLEEKSMPDWESPCPTCSKPCLIAESFSIGRKLCPFHLEHRYTPEQENYHLSVLKHELSRWQNA